MFKLSCHYLADNVGGHSAWKKLKTLKTIHVQNPTKSCWWSVITILTNYSGLDSGNILA